MAIIPVPRTSTAEHEMERVVSGISSTRARADPSACISALNALINTTEGRKILSEQEGEKASVLIKLFDWVVIAPSTLLRFKRAVASDKVVPPDGFERHFSPLIGPLPHICEPPCRVVGTGRAEFDR